MNLANHANLFLLGSRLGSRPTGGSLAILQVKTCDLSLRVMCVLSIPVNRQLAYCKSQVITSAA